MKIQITDYGVSLITGSKEPLKISKAVLGSAYGYTPSKTATGITGLEVYSTNVAGPVVINANVVKYELGIEYDVGPFTFGEIAYLDSNNRCVAIAVADNPIAKLVQTNKARGNSIRVDAYLSMVGTNFNMWIESIGSDIDFYVPIISSFDILPTVVKSDPNFYIVDSVSSNASATLAYSGNTGIWEFDNYLFSNTREYRITSSTATTVTIDISALDADARETLVSKFYGDKLIEFNSGALYSICRTPLNIRVQSNNAVISFRTPLAELPSPKDTLLLFSRSDVSISDLVLPVATDVVLGAIKLGDGLVGDVDGTAHVEFPVTSVNGQLGDVQLAASDIKGLATVATSGRYEDLIGKPASYRLPVATSTILGGVKPQAAHFNVGNDGSLTLHNNYIQTVNGITPDSNGNVTLPEPDPVEGLVTPTQLPAAANLDNYTTAGLFYASDGSNFVNGPIPAATKGLTLEVIPIKSVDGACVQRYTCDGHIFIRCKFMTWSAWVDISSSGGQTGIASYTSLGKVYVQKGHGITVGSDGGIAVQGGKGITVSSDGIQAAVTSVNGKTGDVQVSVSQSELQDAVKHLTNVPDGIAGLTSNNEGDWDGARLFPRQVALGTFLYAGDWDASQNLVTDNNIGVAGSLKLNPNGYMLETTTDQQLDGTGYVFYCSTAGNTDLDGNNNWQVGDLIIGFSNIGWTRLGGLQPPTNEGSILYSKGGKWIELQKGSNNSILIIDNTGNLKWLAKGAPNTVLGIDENGDLAWLSRITTTQLTIG